MADQASNQESQARPTTCLSRFRKAFFSLLVLLIVIGGGETLCRVLGLGRRIEVAKHVSEWQRSLDGQPFWVMRGADYNSDGMRDREHSIDKPRGVYRIICLGDSVTVGHGVARSETYARHLESFLGQLGLDVEVLSIAVSGWSTQQQAIAYQTIARKYHPDQVFVGFCLNDVAEMFNNLTEPPPSVVSFLLRHSALVRFLINAEGRQVHYVEELFTKSDSPAIKEGWRRVFEQLLLLKDMGRADKCAVSVIVFPFRFQLGDDPPPPIAQTTLTTFCRQNDIPCLDLLPALRDAGLEAFIDESHLSPTGARATARELVRWGRSGCEMCGYELTGVAADRCPRCGHAIMNRP